MSSLATETNFKRWPNNNNKRTIGMKELFGTKMDLIVMYQKRVDNK